MAGKELGLIHWRIFEKKKKLGEKGFVGNLILENIIHLFTNSFALLLYTLISENTLSSLRLTPASLHLMSSLNFIK